MTTNEMLALLRAKLEAPGTTVYTDAELLVFLQESYREVINHLDSFNYYHYLSTTTLTFTTGTKTYSLSGISWRKIRKVVDLENQIEYREVPVENLPEFGIDACYVYYILQSTNTLYLFEEPLPGTYSVFYVPTLDTLAAGGAGPLQVPDNWHGAVVEHAAMSVNKTEKELFDAWTSAFQQKLQTFMNTHKRPGPQYVRVTEWN